MWMEQGPYGLIPWLERSLSAVGVKFWYDTQLRKNIGELYGRKIIAEIEHSDLAVLLISQDFLNSTFIDQVEMPLIKQRVDSKKLGVIPILVDYANAKLSLQMQWINDRQMLPSDPEPLSQYINNEPRWAKVRAEILEAFTHQIDRIRPEKGDSLPADLEMPSDTISEYQVESELLPPCFSEKESNAGKNIPEPEPTDAPYQQMDSRSMKDNSSAIRQPFGEDDLLRTHLFAFNLSHILIRAAKRRNLQNRAHITPQDMICGLVRKGDLTRTVLISMNLHPDKIYRKISESNEAGDSPVSDWRNKFESLSAKFMSGKISKDELNALLNYWFVRHIDDFSTESLDAFQQASAVASKENRSKINEFDFLNHQLRSKAWQQFSEAGLPTAKLFSDYLLRIIADGRVDYNGNLNFDNLDQSASMVIGRAHSLAQKYGYRPISHRVILASLIYDEGRFGRLFLHKNRKNPDQVVGYLLGSLSGGSSETFGLSLEVCQPLLIPVVQQAKYFAGLNNLVTDEHLFWAFIRLASGLFKNWLQKSPVSMNLDKLSAGQRPPGATIH
jgi:hypothetical protein